MTTVYQKMIRTHSIFLTLFLCLFAGSLKAQSTYTVEYFGALRATIQNGDISANADLADFKNRENLYALGAFENLKGEILILDGKSYSTRASSDDQVQFINAYDEEKANLLILASVEEWDTIELPGHISSMKELEEMIENRAEEYGLDMNRPFPYLIEGKFGALNWHVIDWPEGDDVHTHQKHRTSGPYGVLEDQNVKILGFWSDSHHGIFTHHSTNLHMHFVTEDETLAGHLDDLENGRNLTLYFPKRDQ